MLVAIRANNVLTHGNRPVSPDRALAFLMALHSRLGRASPAWLLNDALARHIAADLGSGPPRSVWP